MLHLVVWECLWGKWFKGWSLVSLNPRPFAHLTDRFTNFDQVYCFVARPLNLSDKTPLIVQFSHSLLGGLTKTTEVSRPLHMVVCEGDCPLFMLHWEVRNLNTCGSCQYSRCSSGHSLFFGLSLQAKTSWTRVVYRSTERSLVYGSQGLATVC